MTATGRTRATSDPLAGVTSWSPAAPIAGAGTPTGLACPSTALCAVSDSHGNVFTTTNPTAEQPTWTTSSLSLLPLSDVACPTAGLCLATDWQGNVLVSTDPAAAAPRWTQAGRAFGRLACPSAGFCAAAALAKSLAPLLSVSGRGATLRALRKRGRYVTTFTALTPGRLVVTWSTVPRSRKAKARALATARVTIRRAGRVTVTLKLTKEFRRLTRSAKRLKVRIKTTFTPSGRRSVTATKVVTLRR